MPQKPDTTIIVYVETTSKFIKWDTAWKSGRSYAIASQVIVNSPFNAGIAKKGDRKFILNIPDGNYLWQLYLAPHQKSKSPSKPFTENEILLKGKYKGKTILQKAADPVQLETIPSV